MCQYQHTWPTCAHTRTSSTSPEVLSFQQKWSNCPSSIFINTKPFRLSGVTVRFLSVIFPARNSTKLLGSRLAPALGPNNAMFPAQHTGELVVGYFRLSLQCRNKMAEGSVLKKGTIGSESGEKVLTTGGPSPSMVRSLLGISNGAALFLFIRWRPPPRRYS